MPASAPTPSAPPDPDDDVGKDGKKKKNTYKYLIKNVPGASTFIRFYLYRPSTLFFLIFRSTFYEEG